MCSDDGMVVNVAVSVAVVAAIARTAEHRAGPSRHRAYRAADHCSDRTADRRARDARRPCPRSAFGWRKRQAQGTPTQQKRFCSNRDPPCRH